MSFALVFSPSNAQLTTWQYAVPVDITENSGSNLINWQVPITFDTQTPIGSGKMNTNGSDIRFAEDIAGVSLLNYWVESGINTTTTKLWVSIPSISASSTITVYLFYGDSTAPSLSTLSIFNGPHSSTDSVTGGSSGGVANCQRGFRFTVNEDVLIAHFGKSDPVGNEARFVTLFDYNTQNIVEQHQVSAGVIGVYNYDTLNQPFWVSQGDDYVLALHSVTTGYYFGTSTQIGQHFTYTEMKYCNSCNENTFPTSTLAGYHYGYPDLLYYTRNQVSTQPTAVTGAEVRLNALEIADVAICSGDSATLNLLVNDSTGGLIPPFTFLWTPSTNLSCTTCQNPVASPTVTTTYSVVVTDSVGAIDSAEVIVTVSSALPVASAGNDTTICEGNSVMLNGSGGVTYLWSPSTGLNDSSLANAIATPIVTTTYTLTAINGCGSDVDAMVLTVNPLPVVVSSDTSICPGDAVQLLATGGVTYLWSPGASLSDSTIANPIASPITTTMYTINVISGAGCMSVDSLTVSVDSVQAIIATTSKDTICPNDSVQLNVLACATYTDDFESGPGVWVSTSLWHMETTLSNSPTTSWTYNTGSPNYNYDTGTNLGSLTSGTIDLTGSQPTDTTWFTFMGYYETETVGTTWDQRWIQISTNGGPFVNYIQLSGETMLSWHQHQFDISSYNGNNIQIRFFFSTIDGVLNDYWGWSIDDIEVSCNGIDTNLAFVWTPTTGLSNPNIFNPVATPTVTTTYIVSASIGSCSSTDTVTVYVDTNNSVSIDPVTSFCINDSVQLSVSGSSGQPDTSTWTYAWTPGNTLTDSSAAAPMAFPIVNTTYQVTIDNVCGTFTDTITVVVNPVPIADAGLDTGFCYGLDVQLTATGGVTYLWSPPTSLSCTACDKTTANPTINMMYYVEAFDSIGCSSMDSVFVEVNGVPITATADPIAICGSNDSTQLDLNNCSNNIFFDDFESGNYNQWNTAGYIYNVVNTTSANGVNSLEQTGSGGFYGGLNYTFTPDTPDYMSVYMSTSQNTTFNSYFCVGDVNITSNFGIIFLYAINGNYRLYANGSNQVLTPYVVGQWYKFEFMNINYGANTFDYYVDGVLMATAFPFRSTTTNDAAVIHIFNVNNFAANYDDVRIGNECLPLDTTASYSWSPALGLSNAGIYNPWAGPDTTTTYVVTMNDNGCMSTDTITIFIDSTFITPSNDTTICIGDTAQLDVNSNTPTAVYSWTPFAGLSDPNIKNPLAYPTVTTSYAIKITNTNGCQITDTVLVTVNVPPTAAFTSTSTDLLLVATDASLDVDSWLWDFGDGFLSTLQNPSHTYASTGTYWVCLVATNGCSSDTYCDSVTIVITGCVNTVAAFSTIDVALTVVFNDASSDADNWAWDFGDGGTSTSQNPVYTYAADGIYNVCLITTNSCSADTLCMNIMVSASGGCQNTVAGFTSNSVGLQTVFTDTSSDATTWFWDFGDTITSTAQNPVHTYLADGTYYVCLITTNPCSSDTLCDSVTVLGSSCQNTVAAFSFADSGLTVQFTDASSDATSWLWDFDDGNTSNTINPSYTYAAAGTYNVCLITTNPCSADTTCTMITVIPCAAPSSSFSTSMSDLTVTFSDQSTGADSWSWDFGDLNASNAQNPVYSYSSAGSYYVCLTATNTCGSDVFCDSITVSSCPATIALFSYNTSTLTVTFSDASLNAGSWSWDFGDGFFGSAQNPTHTYLTPGTYTVCLTASSACSSDSSCVQITVNAVGIDDIDLSKAEIYPNPTDGIINIDVPNPANEKVSVTIYNLVGEVIYFTNEARLITNNKQASMASYRINLDNISNGSYLIKIKVGDKNTVEEMIFMK